ncbi:beta-ketoacyl-[acyl-carrier-protein] synthase family protein [uncultured Weeksella sp.]|uniref:beta-ketoacyl-[acyl-carrier-protein] synthase family protein n=1 Tax=uncultured Weeksella sp. TaxID=1161389 RepID=UPI00259BDF33|nr:beta-ketoacyl-[acyl-carrier-protein] synthase family protein [uncultured Weeksella sp.]
MATKIAITGMGIISAIGHSVAENLDSLLHNKSGLEKIKYLSTKHKNEFLVGEVKKSNQELASILGLPNNHTFTRTALLGAVAAKEAVKNANLTWGKQDRIGLISSTSVGGMDQSELYFFDYENQPDKQKFILSHDAGDSSIKIAEIIGLEGYVSTVSTACSSAANAIIMGARLISSGKLDCVIVGGTDALSKFTLNGFKSLMILSDCANQPFDENRKGLNLGEGAAYLVLESEEYAQKNQRQINAYLSGYGNANDAHHQTASSENGEGAYLAMQKALSVAKISPENIDYINAHGTATRNNDASESAALLRIFDKKTLCFSSTKPFTGHTLAAAAGIEAVFSILALEKQKVWANLNFAQPMQTHNLHPQTKIYSKKIEHVLSNSFGFGGNCSTLIFSKA